MSTTTAPTFVATVSAGTAAEAVAKIARFVGPEAAPRFALANFEVTGRVCCRSEQHRLWNVEVANHGGNANEAWVILTSFGISPSAELGSTWEEVFAR